MFSGNKACASRFLGGIALHAERDPQPFLDATMSVSFWQRCAWPDSLIKSTIGPMILSVINFADSCRPPLPTSQVAVASPSMKHP